MAVQGIAGAETSGGSIAAATRNTRLAGVNMASDEDDKGKGNSKHDVPKGRNRE